MTVDTWPGLPTDRSLHAAHRRRNELHGSARRPVLSGLRGRESGTALARVHGVGLDPASIERLGSLDVTLVWSPRSNLVLYARRWTCSTRCGPAPGLVWRRSWVTPVSGAAKAAQFLDVEVQHIAGKLVFGTLSFLGRDRVDNLSKDHSYVPTSTRITLRRSGVRCERSFLAWWRRRTRL